MTQGRRGPNAGPPAGPASWSSGGRPWPSVVGGLDDLQLRGDPSERAAALKDIGLDELTRRLSELVPTRGRIAVEVATNLALDVLSVGVPLLGTAAAGLKGMAELQRQRLEWTAVLLALREGTRRSALKEPSV